MHESGVVASLVARAEAIVEEACARPRRIGIEVGALSGIDPDAVRAHWPRFAGPSLDGAELEIQADDDPGAIDALRAVLRYVDIADDGGA